MKITHKIKQYRLVSFAMIGSQLAVLIAGLLAPMVLFTNSASAAQITSRSVTITTSKASATGVNYTYGFTYVTSASAIQSVSFQACTLPLGTCVSPGGTINMNAGSQVSTVGGSWVNTTAFTRDTVGTGVTGNCQSNSGSNVNWLCIKRTQAVAESAAAKTITWDTQTNPTTVGSYYVRITLYSDTAWTTATDSGVVAYAVASQLTLNARIQEILNFCVGTAAATSDNATVSPGTDCSAISGTTVDIGVLDAGVVNTSPVSTNGGSNTVGVAMVRSNGQTGVIITYYSEQDTSSGTLKVAGASCGSIVPVSGSTTDQCINSSSTQAVVAAGVERFGMTIGGVNCGSTISYTCTFASGLTNLAPSSGYIGGTYVQGTSGTYGTGTGVAWNSTTTPVTIASSAGSPVKVVDDEALMLKFQATPQITTPTGAYTVTSTYVATATY